MIESIDPLIKTLWAIQSSANNKKIPTTLKWEALNQLGKSNNLPQIDAHSFNARWKDPVDGEILKQFVTKFDGEGVEINTSSKDSSEVSQQDNHQSTIDSAAKRASTKTLKNS